MGAALPLITAALPYLVPAIALVAGHITGWFHHKHVVAKRASTKW